MRMKLVKVNGADVGIGQMGQGKWVAIVNEFIASDMQVAEVTELDVDLNGAYNGMRSMVSRHGLPVRVVRRKNRLFLVRTEEWQCIASQ